MRRRSLCLPTITRIRNVLTSPRGSRGWKTMYWPTRTLTSRSAFCPTGLTGVDDIGCLNENEKLQLNQIMGNAYCHIFAFVEEFIIPTVTEEAMKDVYGDEVRARSLLRFAEEEFKHQELFRRSVDLFGQGFGTECGLIPGREDVARVVRSKSKLAVMILTAIIEWFTPAPLHRARTGRRGPR